MATTLNAGTTTATALNVITDTTGAMAIQTSGTTAIAISNAQVVSLTNPLLPASGGTGITSLGTGVATFLGTPTSANLAAALTDETGTGANVFANSPTLASPTLTGTPLAPTATTGTNTTQIATTAFVLTNGLPSGAIVLWSGSIASIPSGWYLCNGTNGTPNLQDRFVAGAGSTYAVGATGGSADATLPSHTHTAASTVTDSGHYHTPSGGGGFRTLGSSLPQGGGYTGSSGSTDYYTSTATTGITVATTNAAAGSSATNANLPPYYALAYIMKA